MKIKIHFRSLSIEAQDIADSLFMPRITSQTDHTSEKNGSVTDNGYKKVH